MVDEEKIKKQVRVRERELKGNCLWKKISR